MSASKKFFRPGSKRTKEFLLAKTMMVLVLVFLILNPPRLILGMIEVTQLTTVEECYEHGLDYHVSKQTYILDFLARFLVILNSSVNFLIYCLVGSEFRSKLSSSLGLSNMNRRRRRGSAKSEVKLKKDNHEGGGKEETSWNGTVLYTTMELGASYLNR